MGKVCYMFFLLFTVPGFAIVVVKKRINTRLFGIGREQLINPLPGIVADTEVTKPEWLVYITCMICLTYPPKQFFLVSQSVCQETVSPTHYNLVHDATGLKSDHMQCLMYKLNHLYYNWSVSIYVMSCDVWVSSIFVIHGQCDYVRTVNVECYI